MRYLKPQTIISGEMYVRRAADRQLRQILEDMGRPGYVLVARQMGKTNLLLNAKREASSLFDVFAYIDVSNIYPDVRSFLRNVIDTVIESSAGSMDDLSTEFSARRSQTVLLPHKEHERELRDILGRLQGKIVICLDEIDALTKTDYSDQVFSFIRSIYFSGRANFREFDRLTYVLSGVAEPADIIKNKEISPFNIGEKIYLDDFSFSEFEEFVNKANLELQPEIRERVYYWTSGNPRVTWDLCAAIEDRKIRNLDLTADIVDGMVESLYLTTYDLPPVDHIRQLASENKEIRDAILAIHNNNAPDISDTVRNKLYLAGIVGLDASTRTTVIKNKILERALSEQWLAQIERNIAPLNVQAESEYGDRNYRAALDLFKEFIVGAKDEPIQSRTYYMMGLCAYELRDYESAIEYLTTSPFKKTVLPAAYFASMAALAQSYFFIGDYEKSSLTYRTIASESNRIDYPAEFYSARIGLAGALVKLNADMSEAETLYRTVIEEGGEFEAHFSDSARWARSVSNARLNLATVLHRTNKPREALELLRSAPGTGDEKVLVRTFQLLAIYSPDLEERQQVLRHATRLIIENRLRIDVQSIVDDGFSILASGIALMISQFKEAKNEGDISALLTYVASDFCSRSEDAVDACHTFISELFKIEQYHAAVEFIEIVVNKNDCDFTPRDVRLLIAIGLIADSHFDHNIHFEQRYIDALENDATEFADYDYGAVLYIVRSAIKRGDHSLANKVVGLSADRRSLALGQEIVPGEAFVQRYLEALTKLTAHPNLETIRVAVDLASELKVVSPIAIPFFGPDAAPFMRSTLLRSLEELKPLKENVPIRRTTEKRGRNERVRVRFTDGSIREGKFKNFESQLLSGKCSLL